MPNALWLPQTFSNSNTVFNLSRVKICVGYFKLRVSCFNFFTEARQLCLKFLHHLLNSRLIELLFREVTQANLRKWQNQTVNQTNKEFCLWCIFQEQLRKLGWLTQLTLHCVKTYHISEVHWQKPHHCQKVDWVSNSWENLQNCLHAWLPLSGWWRF